jgi:hypothetical protein
MTTHIPLSRPNRRAQPAAVRRGGSWLAALLHSPLRRAVGDLLLLITVNDASVPLHYTRRDDCLVALARIDDGWWGALCGGARVAVEVCGQTLPAIAEAHADPGVVCALLHQWYPGLSADQRARFAEGKAAVIITPQTA